MGLNYANRFLHNLLERCALDIHGTIFVKALAETCPAHRATG